MWAVAFFLINVVIIIIIGAIFYAGILVSPYDAIVMTLAGTLFLNILMTFTGFSSLTAATGRPAAGFSVLFSSVALCIMGTLIYIILKTDVPEEVIAEETTQAPASIQIENEPRITVSTIS